MPAAWAASVLFTSRLLSSIERAFIEAAYRDLQVSVEALAPSTFHPAMEVTLAGRLLHQLLEVRAITDDVQQSFGAGC